MRHTARTALATLLCGLAMLAPARASATATVGAATADAACGDADGDGTRTVTDGVRILRAAADLAGSCDVASRCDVDGDGAITVSDGVAALRLAAGLPVDTACRDAVIDRSSFTIFTFDRRAAFGFCPPLDSAAHVILSVVGDRVELDASIITAGTPGDPDCLADVTTVPAGECARETMLAERTLTADEAARVRAAFAAVTLEQQQHPDCTRVQFDPCLLDEFRWDGFIVTDFVCGAPRLLSDQSEALIDVLDSLLRPPST